MLTNCHSYYSFKYGTISTEDLIKVLVHYGYNTFALTDINNTAASIDFTRLALQNKVKPVVGVDFRNGVQQQYVAIAQNNKGFREINEYLTPHLHEKIAFDAQAPAFKNAFIIYPFTYADDELRDNEFIGVSIEELKQLPFSKWKNRPDKLVIKQTCTFRNKHDFNAHRLLRAIDNNTLLSKLPPTEQARETDRIVPLDELLLTYADYPQIIKNTEQLLAACSIDFNFGTNKNRQIYTHSNEADFELLKKRCEEGLAGSD